jgi:DNA-binding NarL/FixJ family response regulator
VRFCRFTAKSFVYRIFIVEDEPAMLDAYRLMFQHTHGFKLAGAVRTGEEALAQIAGQQLDLVLVDLALPHMNGLEFIRRLQDEQPTLPILIVSGHDRDVYLKPNQPPLSPMVKGYILKYKVPQVLFEAMRQALRSEQWKAPAPRSERNRATAAE